MGESKILLSMTAVSKRFGGVQAVDQVDLEVREGEILALVGENGAGKSTLMNVLGGIVVKDGGQITIGGVPYEPRNARDARRAGIAFIHQELTLFPSLTVGENIFIEHFPKGPGRLITHKVVYQDANQILQRLGVNVDSHTKVRNLPIGDRQLVEIAKAMSGEARLMIFDEPTSSLSEAERERLFMVIRSLRAAGTSIIYISHLLDEIFAIADRVSVMRDGRHVGTVNTAESNRDEIIHMMVGRKLREALERQHQPSQEVALRVEKLSRAGYLEDISFELHKGEILGVWGLLGSGRTELARAIFGLDPTDCGTVTLDEQELRERTPERVTKAGIGYLTESRRDDGLILPMSVRENVTLANLRRVVIGPAGRISRKLEGQIAAEQVDRLHIVAANTEVPVEHLSGGNQQKVVFAKWLSLAPSVYILDEPTRGVDVGAKDEIHRTVLALADAGASVVLISSEMEEIMRLSDRILVMHRGSFVAEMRPRETSQEELLKYATGG